MDQPMSLSANVKGETFTDCRLEILRGENSLESHDGGECVIDVYKDGIHRTLTVRFRNGSESAPCFKVTKGLDHSKVGTRRYLVDLPEAHCSLLIEFSREEDMLKFKSLICTALERLNTKSVFDERTDKASATQYFQFYGYLSQQQNMMQDYIRTSTYQRAMLQNHADFKDKVVIDVGAGSGILSFFAVQAGAKKVYAIEASSMARHAEKLVQFNNLSDKIVVVPGKVEENINEYSDHFVITSLSSQELQKGLFMFCFQQQRAGAHLDAFQCVIDIPEQVDVIISEPMGYMLFNERMLESYLHAKKWLKPGGKMFPTRADLHIAPFFDDVLYMEHFSKSNFWYQNSFYGVDLSNLRQAAVDEYFKQPIVDTFDVRILMAKPNTHTTDFLTATEEDLQRIEVPLKYTVFTGGTVHGLAFWFDVVFQGSCLPVWLSTAPQEPLTHWYQVRCLLPTPIFVKAGQTLTGKVLLRSNERQSYDVDIELSVDGTGIKSQNTLDLKNPFFRYTGTQPAIPAGSNTVSPTDLYWAGTGVNMVDGDMTYSGGNSNTVLVGNAGSAGVLGSNYPGYNSAAATNGVLGAGGGTGYTGINSGMATIPTFGNTHCTNSRFFNGGQSAVLGYSGGYTEYASSNAVTTQGRQYSVIYSR